MKPALKGCNRKATVQGTSLRAVIQRLHSVKPALKCCNKRITVQRHQSIRAAIQKLHSLESALKGCNTKAAVQRHQSKGSNSKAAFHVASIEGLQ
jgi:hypothetical protein